MERLSGSVVQSSANKGSHLRRPRARHRRGAAGRRAPARSGGRFVEYQPTSEASVNRRGISQPARHQSTGEASVNRRGISQGLDCALRTPTGGPRRGQAPEVHLHLEPSLDEPAPPAARSAPRAQRRGGHVGRGGRSMAGAARRAHQLRKDSNGSSVTPLRARASSCASSASLLCAALTRRSCAPAPSAASAPRPSSRSAPLSLSPLCRARRPRRVSPGSFAASRAACCAGAGATRGGGRNP
jgi:hypothetical protein